jgi:putative hydrolase of the HAD superfamily
MFDLIAFDADDTLWHNERLFSAAFDSLYPIIEPYVTDHTNYKQRIDETNVRNLDHYGYGIKAFILSTIESAIEITGGRIPAAEIAEILDVGRGMLAADIDLLEHVPTVIPMLAADYPLIIITKGDLLDQEAKVARSKLAEHFRAVEIVSNKTPDAYAAILKKHHVEPQHFLMVGNSLKSDILPVLAIGAHAVHVPYHITWAHEHVDLSAEERAKYHEIADLSQLPDLLRTLAAAKSEIGAH